MPRQSEVRRVRELIGHAEWLTAALYDLLRELEKEEERDDSDEDDQPTRRRYAKADDKESEEEERPITIGDRVRVTANDQYFGCEGRVSGRRGMNFWYVILDATKKRGEKKIYKMAKNLRRVQG
jgi:hypothetical protein